MSPRDLVMILLRMIHSTILHPGRCLVQLRVANLRDGNSSRIRGGQASLCQAKRNWCTPGLGGFQLSGRGSFENQRSVKNFPFVHEQAAGACDLAAIKAMIR